MKPNELKPCALCKKGLMHSGVPLFYRVTVEVMGVDVQAVRERQGLAMMLGSGPLAEVFAPTSEVANRVTEPDVLLVCHGCATDYGEAHCVMRLAELGRGK